MYAFDVCRLDRISGPDQYVHFSLLIIIIIIVIVIIYLLVCLVDIKICIKLSSTVVVAKN